VQTEVLDLIGGGEPEVFAVWEPILKADDEGMAHRAAVLLPDPRARHFWAPDQRLGRSFQDRIGLDGEPAWDVYLVYLPGISWDDPEAPPRPTYFMHQLRGRLPETQVLDGNRLRSFLETMMR